jgi:hypothetical protein
MRAERDGVDPPDWAQQRIPETIHVGTRIGEEASSRAS